jgi:hypothetical protein
MYACTSCSVFLFKSASPLASAQAHVLALGGHHQWQKEYVLKATNAWTFEVTQVGPAAPQLACR